MSYFDKARKEKALEDLRIIHECADKAGMRDALFVGFGLLLGIVREGDWIGHDNDTDMCVFSHMVTPEQENKYVECLEKKDMFFARRRARFMQDDGAKRLVWFSMRRRKERAKFCHWFWIKHNGYYWHTKGDGWVKPRKMNPKKLTYSATDAAIMKGIPADWLEELMPVDFHGIQVNIPRKYGTCLDWWYDNWRVPAGGSSTKRAVCVVEKWGDRKTWRVSKM